MLTHRPIQLLLGLFRRVPWWVFALIAIAFIGWRYHVGSVRHADRTGYARAIAEVQARIARDQATQIKREGGATRTLQDRRAKDQAAAATRQSEIDNATRNIPDQALSARQFARACVELRAQGKAPPQCRSIGAK